MYHRLGRIYSHHRRIALFYHMLTGKLYKSSHAKVLVSDLMDRRTEPQDNITHCRAALRWIFQAQDSTKVGGVSAEYNFSWGWNLPCPEVSGYIIPSILNLARQFPKGIGMTEIEERASRIADWLVTIQHPDGSYDTGLYYDPKVHGRRPLAQISSTRRKPCAFETGQILWGLTAFYQQTGERRYLEAACKAAEWLVQKQSADGAWASEEQGVPVSFSALTARHLALLAKVTKDDRYEKAAIDNCNWCLSKQNDVGWFNACAHTLGFPPWTHGIGYAAQGLLEAGICLDRDEYIEGAAKTAEALLRVYWLRGFKSASEQEKGFLPARFDNDWRSKDNFSCLVGNAQISLVWSTLYQITNDVRYLNGARKINQDLKSLQLLNCPNTGINGGIKGSHPIWGLYRTFGYPAWAAKFFIDALIAEEQALSKQDEYLKHVLQETGWLGKASYIEDIEGEITELIAQGKIIARFSGRDKWGPRALGNRSILADPRDLQVIRKIPEGFQHITGVGGILNTSFNLHGYPVVGDPKTALRTLEQSDLDGLAIGNWLVSK